MIAKLKHGFKKVCAFCMRKNNRVITLFIVLAVCIFILTPLINPLIQYGEKTYLAHETRVANQYIASQYQGIDAELTSLQTSDALKQLIATKDLAGLQTFADQVRAQKGFDLVVATDEHGVALVRTDLPSSRGDYIFNATAWGQAVSQTGRAITVERGITFPLVMIGGQELKNRNGSLVGAVFVGYQIDNAYLTSFRNRVLPRFMHIVAFTKQNGAIATTFVNPKEQNLASYAFSAPSRWTQETIGIDAPELISLDGGQYFAQGVMFPGLQTSPGGIILLFPYSPFFNILVFTALFTIVYSFFAFTYILKSRKQERMRDTMKKHAGYVAGFCIFTLFLAFFANLYYGTGNTPDVPRGSPALYNSTLGLLPDSDIFTDAEPHTITVSLSSGGELIRAAEATLSFNPSAVSVQKVSLANSLCDQKLFSTTVIDNTGGTITISCAAGPGGFQGKNGTLAQLEIMPKHIGQYDLAFDMVRSHVYADDGLGTDVLRTAVGGSYQVQKPSDSPTMPVLPIFSLSDPNSEQWYNTKTILLSWDPNNEYPSYVYAFDMNATTSPALPTTNNAISLLATQDGVYYFHIAGMRGTTEGPISHFKVMIDSTEPDAPDILLGASSVQTGDMVRIQASSHDGLSGLQRFLYARINNGMFSPFTSPASYSFPKAGTYILTVRAYDNAGNWSESSRTIRVTAPSFFESIKNLLPSAASSIINYLAG